MRKSFFPIPTKSFQGRALNKLPLLAAFIFLSYLATAISDSAEPGGGFLPDLSALANSTAFTLLSPSQSTKNSLPDKSDDLFTLRRAGEMAVLQLSGTLSPYIGAGLQNPETSRSTLEALVHRHDATEYQLGVGLGYKLGEKTRLGLDYRYTPAEDPSMLDDVSSKNGEDNEGHRISLGLKILF